MTNILKRDSKETLDDYLIRLFSNLDNYGIDRFKATELLNEVSGEDYTESKYRKDYAQYVRWYDYIINKNLDQDIVRKHEEMRIEAQKEKIRKLDQKREYDKLIREQARVEHIRDVMIQEIRKLSKTKTLSWSNPTPSKTNREGVVIFSDWHYGLFTTNYWNTFNKTEFNRRLKKLVKHIIEHGKLFGIKKLHTVLLGDLVNGIIHVTTRINSDENVVGQTMQISEILSSVLVELASNFEIIELYNARGNHDRVNPQKKEELAKESFSDLIYWYLRTRLKDIENIRFNDNKFDDEIIHFEIFGQQIFATHGHKDKVNNVAANLSLMTKIVPDYVLMGHTHHHEENEYGSAEVIVNSSFSGIDEYAKDIRKTSKPAQKMIIFDEVETRLDTRNIRLDVGL